MIKYQETDGNYVYTKIQTWAKNRKAEYKLRKWATQSELETTE